MWAKDKVMDMLYAVEDAAEFVLEVSSIAKRFCEAGRPFYQEPTKIHSRELDDEQLELLESSPHLRCRRLPVVEIEVPDTAAGDAA